LNISLIGDGTYGILSMVIAVDLAGFVCALPLPPPV
jgi:hypothetical protein